MNLPDIPSIVIGFDTPDRKQEYGCTHPEAELVEPHFVCNPDDSEAGYNGEHEKNDDLVEHEYWVSGLGFIDTEGVSPRCKIMMLIQVNISFDSSPLTAQ